jgi:hypothetical protein
MTDHQDESSRVGPPDVAGAPGDLPQRDHGAIPTGEAAGLAHAIDGLEGSIDRVLAERDRLAVINAELLATLKYAVTIIRSWDGMGLSASDVDRSWRAYQQSPEMRRINAAIAHAEGR